MSAVYPPPPELSCARGLGGVAARRAQGGLEQAQACTKCPQLASTRTTVVFGAGNADADLMFVGEAPGANEDKQGLPFVGQAGRLLDTLLEEIGLARSDVFIANTLMCRPPGNRDPLPGEIDACQDWLFRKLELIEPRVVCTLGNFSTKLLRGGPGDRASRVCTAARRSAGSVRGRCGCTRSTTRPRRSTRPRCWRSCATDFRRIPELLALPAPDQPAPGGARARRARARGGRRARGAEPERAARAVLIAAARFAACSSAVIA